MNFSIASPYLCRVSSVLQSKVWVSPAHRQHSHLSLLPLLHFTPLLFSRHIWHRILRVTGVDEHSPQQGSLLLVFGRVQGGQDEGLGRLQGILQGLEGRYEDGGPLLLGAAGAAVAVSGCQARQARDGVEVGLVGAHPG